MALRDFLENIDIQIQATACTDFEIEVSDTKLVPSFNDSNITFDNFDTKKKKCKRLESCVLYVDIRDSVKLSAAKKPKTLTKIYSSFVRSMVECGKYYGGHIRNIIGDRVMVVFDQDNCFENAVNTAVLMNTVCRKILNKRFSSYTDLQCGIGIDYGPMLITKTGTIKQGTEKEFYRSLVWLGRPANVASRLTDIAAKKESHTVFGVEEGHFYKYLNEWGWYFFEHKEFVNRLEPDVATGKIGHSDANFKSFIKASRTYSNENKPIFMTKEVYNGYKNACPDDKSILNNWYKKVDISIRDFSGDVYSGDVFFTVVEEVME
ncbi:adenylate/guanylate cyclase domain-containing protein [Vibrio vulnificus]|nr:adenylate/guanylate cyclase domain-containing protein [Vibrio vulnificus]EHH0793154.1 adenylate/guanylate cyclase domain-containing protein [Vibrio vulnificus]ELE1962638.1 adenylate/guanylate cyclase domain-containing protein [Vibrio vulnificus]